MDNRKFFASCSVRVGTARIRFELSQAPLHGGPEGFYRVRMQRRWLDTEEGKARFFDCAALAELLADTVLGALPQPAPAPPAPDIPAKARVSVRQWRDGEAVYVGAWTATPPILAAHEGGGRWMVAVLLYGQGTVFVPCEDIIYQGASHAQK